MPASLHPSFLYLKLSSNMAIFGQIVKMPGRPLLSNAFREFIPGRKIYTEIYFFVQIKLFQYFTGLDHLWFAGIKFIDRRKNQAFTDMQDRRELVKLVARIWRTHYKQEALYKYLMSMDVSGKLRRLCANGHMSSLVFRHEINQIYEILKCSFSDGDLCSIVKNDDESNSENACQASILNSVIEGQADSIASYLAIMELLWDNPEKRRLCADHLEKLKDLSQKLGVEYQAFKRFEPQHVDYESVA
jgi:hypothetical protein